MPTVIDQATGVTTQFDVPAPPADDGMPEVTVTGKRINWWIVAGLLGVIFLAIMANARDRR